MAEDGPPPGREPTLDERRQRAIVHLSRLGLTDEPIDRIAADAVRLVAHDLGSERVALVLPIAGRDQVLADVGWGPEGHDELLRGVSAAERLSSVRVRDLGALVEAADLPTLPAFASVQSLVVAPVVTGTGEPGLLLVADAGRDPVGLVPYAEAVAATFGLVARSELGRRALRDSEARFRSLVEQLPAITYLRSVGEEPRPLYVSPVVEHILGTPASAWLADPGLWAGRIHELDRADALAALGRHQQTRAPLDIVYRMHHADGSIRWLRDRAVIVDRADGTPVQHGVATDVTADRETAVELDRRDQIVAALMAASPVVISAVDERGINTMVAGAVEEVMGRSAGELIGLSTMRFVHEDDVPAINEQFTGLLSGRLDEARGYFRYSTDEGGWLDVEYHARPQVGADGRPHGVVYAMTDASLRLRVENELRAAKVAAEEASDAKSEFLSRMSHELRTPLNAVLGFAQLLELGPLDEEQRDNLDHILRSGRHLLALVDEVLDIARLDTGRSQLSFEAVPVHRVVESVVDAYSDVARTAGVGLRHAGSGGDVFAQADQQRLHQVIDVLVENAIHYSDRGDEVTVTTEDAGDEVVVEVRDTGIGFDAAAFDRIVQPFERLEPARQRRDAAGLGLSLAARLVNAMRADLEAESEPGVGSTFRIRLRRVSPTRIVAGSDETAGVGLRGRLVYIEDNPANIELIGAAVSRHPGIEIDAHLSGRAGLDAAREAPPAAVLLDLHLPDLPGEAVLEALKVDPRTAGVPVIVLSADATRTTIERLLSNGAAAYLTKPIDFRRFFDVLTTVLSDRDDA